MSKSFEHYNVFIASPSDVQEERDIVREVCDELNGNKLVENDNIQFKAVGWEDALPSAGRP